MPKTLTPDKPSQKQSLSRVYIPKDIHFGLSWLALMRDVPMQNLTSDIFYQYLREHNVPLNAEEASCVGSQMPQRKTPA